MPDRKITCSPARQRRAVFTTLIVMSDSIHIPILRLGKPYRSLDTIKLSAAGYFLETSVANSGLIRRDLQKISSAVESLQAIPCDTLAGYCEKAAELYLHASLPWGDGN